MSLNRMQAALALRMGGITISHLACACYPVV